MAATKSKKYESNGDGIREYDEDEGPREVDFAREGNRIVLPTDMGLDEAEAAIRRQKEEENVVVNLNEPIEAFPLDGAVALMRVLKKRYGWTHLVPEIGFWSNKPPTMVAVEIGVNERIQVPWGNCVVPKIDGTINTGYEMKNGVPSFLITGSIKRKHEQVVHQIAEEVRQVVKTQSIYKGKAIKINFRDSEGGRECFDESLAPKFLDLSSIASNEPIFSKVIEASIRKNILVPIRHSKRCRKKGASLKKGVILGGPYGTGKTLTAFQIARICVENGWTFVYLEDVRDLDLALGFAKQYQPVCLFAEDADKALAGPRTSEMDRVLNIIDGVESKNSEQALMLVLTTNHLPVINGAFLRPGRIDTIIEVTPPDHDACLAIVRKYVAEGDCKLEGTDDELKKAIEPLVGANAAFFRNAVEQAKLSAIENMPDDDADVIIRPQDLRIISEGMVAHARLLNPDHGKKPLLDLENTDVRDPLTLASEILVQKFAEGFVSQITNPKVLEKVIFKKMKRSGGGPFSNN